ncbi:MAG TPA: sigma-70 family RNA polymerase sigma factor, partial [Desulfuromonadaceae bacterium]|nr:sigma-70 family RNA polymerase sigma factor [Desulfuromonadaceae bacterium]
PLVRYAAQITGDLDRARDVVQDTFIRLCDEKQEKVGPHLAAWLFKVCRNRALDVQRKESRMKTLDQTEINSRAGDGPSPAAALEQREAANEVLQLLGTLSKNQQEVVRLKFQNGLSYQEISDVTNLTVSNVGVLIHTALKTLRQKMQPRRTP